MRTRFSPLEPVDSPYVYVYDSPVDVYSDVPVVSIVDDRTVEPREVIVP
jgi:hypothetical protein